MTHWTRFWTFHGLLGKTASEIPTPISSHSQKIPSGVKAIVDARGAMSHERIEVLMRISRILRQHTRDEDLQLSDRDLILKVFGRWLGQQAGVVLDPNE